MAAVRWCFQMEKLTRGRLFTRLTLPPEKRIIPGIHCQRAHSNSTQKLSRTVLLPILCRIPEAIERCGEAIIKLLKRANP